MAKKRAKPAPVAAAPLPAPPPAPDPRELAAEVRAEPIPTIGRCDQGDLVRVPSGVVGYVAWHMDFHGEIYETFIGLVAEEPGPPEAWSRGAEHGHRAFPADTPIEMLVSQRRRSYEGDRFPRSEVRDPLTSGDAIP